jgi:hypothetical protein
VEEEQACGVNFDGGGSRRGRSQHGMEADTEEEQSAWCRCGGDRCSIEKERSAWCQHGGRCREGVVGEATTRRRSARRRGGHGAGAIARGAGVEVVGTASRWKWRRRRHRWVCGREMNCSQG